MSSCTKTFCVAILTMFVTAVGNAATIINWDGNYVTANQNLQGFSSAGIAFSDTALRNPTNGYSGTSSNFYGGASVDSGQGKMAQPIVRNNGTQDTITVPLDTSTKLNQNEHMTAVWLWKQAGFLNGLESGAVVVTSMYCWINYGFGNFYNFTGRFVIAQSSKYYISQNVRGTGAATNVLQIANMSAVQWYAYWPTGTLDSIGAPATIGAFTNITGVGIWQECIRNGNGAKDASMEMQTFRVQGYKIDEPLTNWTANSQMSPSQTTTQTVAGMHCTIMTNLFNGSGKLVKRGAGVLTFRCTISPGFSPGTVDIAEVDGIVQLGSINGRALLNIENGDRISLTNMDASVDLSNLDVFFVNRTASGTTNWFLTVDSSFVSTFHSISATTPYVPIVIYEPSRVGVVVLPEPMAPLCVLCIGAMLGLRRRS